MYKIIECVVPIKLRFEKLTQPLVLRMNSKSCDCISIISLSFSKESGKPFFINTKECTITKKNTCLWFLERSLKSEKFADKYGQQTKYDQHSSLES